MDKAVKSDKLSVGATLKPGEFLDRTDDGRIVVKARCRACGTSKIKGRCPVAKKDCGR